MMDLQKGTVLETGNGRYLVAALHPRAAGVIHLEHPSTLRHLLRERLEGNESPIVPEAFKGRPSYNGEDAEFLAMHWSDLENNRANNGPPPAGYEDGRMWWESTVYALNARNGGEKDLGKAALTLDTKGATISLIANPILLCADMDLDGILHHDFRGAERSRDTIRLGDRRGTFVFPVPYLAVDRLGMFIRNLVTYHPDLAFGGRDFSEGLIQSSPDSLLKRSNL